MITLFLQENAILWIMVLGIKSLLFIHQYKRVIFSNNVHLSRTLPSIVMPYFSTQTHGMFRNMSFLIRNNIYSAIKVL